MTQRIFVTSLALLSLASSASVLGVGCSEPPPVIPRGAWSVSFLDSGAACSVASHNSQMGLVNDQQKLTLIQDGDPVGNGDATVECTIKGGGPYDISARAFLFDKSLVVNLAGFDPAAATSDMPAPGTVAYASVNTAGEPYVGSVVDTPCEFYLSGKEEFGPGEVWMSFRCPLMTGEQSQCTISQGYLAFENCTIET
jgi:hypothetical protein